MNTLYLYLSLSFVFIIFEFIHRTLAVYKGRYANEFITHYQWRKNGFYLLIVWFFCAFLFSFFPFGSYQSWKKMNDYLIRLKWSFAGNKFRILYGLCITSISMKQKKMRRWKGPAQNWEFYSRISLAWLFKTHYTFIISLFQLGDDKFEMFYYDFIKFRAHF